MTVTLKFDNGEETTLEEHKAPILSVVVDPTGNLNSFQIRFWNYK